MRHVVVLALFLAASACSDEAVRLDGSVSDAAGRDAAALDASVGPVDGAAPDGTLERDAEVGRDASSPDTAVADASPPDTAVADAASPDATPGADAAAPDTGVGPMRGTCRSAADCGGGACLAVPAAPGGWGTCDTRPAPATACGGGFDACCTSADCGAEAGGACFGGPLFYCGGAFPEPANVCAYPECAVDADCTSTTRTDPVGLCVPAGAFAEPTARCSYGDCRLDSDCSARAGGQCRPFFNPCNRRLDAFHCTYADSVCRQDTDCAGTSFGYCAPGLGGVTTCEMFIPPP
jgi:hypothetical protein